MATFTVQETSFDVPSHPDDPGTSMSVRSVPRPYEVDFLSAEPLGSVVNGVLGEAGHPLLLADERVLRIHLADLSGVADDAVMGVEATEQFKAVEGALSVLDFMDRNRMSRGSLLVVVGGGIVQDVGAFVACVYKRGVPWVYIPTTLLAQADSCIGAKSGLNFKGAKNLLGVFCAPRRVIVHTGFLDTLADEDILSGLGEVFRLSIVGGPETLETFESLLPGAIARSGTNLESLIRLALSVKRAVIECDEYELDLRRSMNFGHTIGHALEAITGHAIPHGTAVAIGVLVESHMSCQQGMLSESDLERLVRTARPLVPEEARKQVAGVSFEHLLDVLFRDKKAEGSVLKLVVPQAIGALRFVDLPLEPATVPRVRASVEQVLESL